MAGQLRDLGTFFLVAADYDKDPIRIEGDDDMG